MDAHVSIKKKTTEETPVGAPAGALTKQETLAVMQAAEHIAITGHLNPDGDALGSSLALRDLLRAMGKDVVVLLAQDRPAPALYSFLPEYEFVYASEYTRVPDLLVIVDASTAKRLGTSEAVAHRAKKTLVIDHHANYEDFAQYYHGDTRAPAAASLIWKLIKASTVEPTINMARYCYVGIMTDTGRFAFANTDCRSFKDAAEMIALGVNPAQMSQQVYENKTLPAMQMEALLIDRISFSCKGCIDYSYILQEDLERLGLERDATEQLPTILRSIKGVEVAVLFRDEKNEGVRVNLRSSGNYNVGAFALSFGGGGHAGAAGFTIDLPLKEAMKFVIDKLKVSLPACNACDT